MTQQVADWIASNSRVLEYFGVVPVAIVPDRLKAAVTTSCRYEPGIQHNSVEQLHAEAITDDIRSELLLPAGAT